jgi:hypothetical protein
MRNRPNGRWVAGEPTEARCVGCGKVQTSIYPGAWGLSLGLGLLLLDRAKSLGVCTNCVTPANQTRFWDATRPQPTVAK